MLTDLERVRAAAESLAWRFNGDRDGVARIGADVPEPFERGHDLAQPDALVSAAALVVELGLSVAAPVYFDAESFNEWDVLRSHVMACRFRPGHEPADLLELDPAPDAIVWVGDVCESWAIWGCPEPIGPELPDLQAALRDRVGGDPDWPALASSLIPVPGARYVVDGRELEAREWTPESFARPSTRGAARR